MAKLNPHLRFNDGCCKEAMEFYRQCLGGDLNFMTVADSPMAKDMPSDLNKIMHSTLTNSLLVLSASDMMRDKAVMGDDIALSLTCETEEEAKMLFLKLSDGGAVFMPLEVQFWGGLFGMVTDKFGKEWTISYQKA